VSVDIWVLAAEVALALLGRAGSPVCPSLPKLRLLDHAHQAKGTTTTAGAPKASVHWVKRHIFLG